MNRALTAANELPMTGSESPEIMPGDFYGNFIQVVVVLAVIIGLIVLLIRFLAAKNKQWSGNRSLRVHAGVALGQHKSMQIVEIGGTLYIVGIGEDITLLDKIDDEARVADLLASLEARPAPSMGTAAEALGQWLRSKRRREEPETETDQTLATEAFQELLNDKLKGLGSRKETLKAWMEEEQTPKRERSDDR